MAISINNISFSYTDSQIFKNFNLEISTGEVTTILGPSGCGKTTLLSMISGIIKPDNGEVIYPKNQKLSSIFQEHRLLPWMNVLDNVLFTMDNGNDDNIKRSFHYLKKMGLKDHLNKYPNQLSGGMAQRVSIARAFSYPSNTILMDEPFKGLDLQLKLNIINLFNSIWSEDSRTGVFVTHDIIESLLIGDKIIIFTEAPVKIYKIITNSIPKDKRTLENLELLNMEKELYTLLSQL